MSLTKRQTKRIRKGVCPDCKSKEWYAGPRGGECQNIECANCGSRFNVGPDYAERIGPGLKRIVSDDKIEECN